MTHHDTYPRCVPTRVHACSVLTGRGVTKRHCVIGDGPGRPDTRARIRNPGPRLREPAALIQRRSFPLRA
jgi:hypothetical protein